MNTLSHFDTQSSMCPCCAPKMWHHSPYATTYSQFIDYGATTTPTMQHNNLPYFPSVDMGDTGVDDFPVSLSKPKTQTEPMYETPVMFERKLVLWSDRWHMVRGKPALESFWPINALECLSDLTTAFTNHRAADIAVNSSLHIFQKGVEPTYADPRNSRGGHFTIRIGDVASADGMWQYVSTEVAFCRLPYAKKITGVSLLRKPKYMCLQLWLNDSRKQGVLDAIRESLLAALGNGRPLKIKFSPHRYLLDSIAEASAVVPALQSHQLPPPQVVFQQPIAPKFPQTATTLQAPFTGILAQVTRATKVTPTSPAAATFHAKQEWKENGPMSSALASPTDAATPHCATQHEKQAAPPARPLCAFFYKAPASQGSSIALNVASVFA